MPEYIEREAAKEEIMSWAVRIYDPKNLSTEDTMQVLDSMPAADVVAVVRCGECERRCKSADLTDSVYCPWLKLQMRKNDFCSYGERRGEDG